MCPIPPNSRISPSAALLVPDPTSHDSLNDTGPRTPTAATWNLTKEGSLYAFLTKEFYTESQLAKTRYPGAFALESEIHPLLAPEQWKGDLRWEVLTPVLQLASKLLLSTNSMHYLYAAILSPLVEVDFADRETGKVHTRLAIFRKGAALTAEEHAQIEATLFGLLDLITFSTVPLSTYARCGQAVARRETDAFHLGGPDGAPWEGVASDISISKFNYDILCDLHDVYHADPTSQAKRILQVRAFDMARTICHEVAHAIKIARFNGYRSAVGFETQYISEDGFDWESCVFGGITDVRGMFEWPSPSHFESYMRTGNTMFVAQRPEADVDVQWRVPEEYLRSVFLEANWEELEKEGGLKVPKLLGYRIIPCAERGACACAACVKAESVIEYRIQVADRDDDEEDGSEDEKDEEDHGSEHEDNDDGSEHEDNKDVSEREDNEPRSQTAAAQAVTEPCERARWAYFPFGCSDQRKQGADMDVRTYGVPEGFASLLDGTVVPLCMLETMQAEEERQVEQDAQKAEQMIAAWEKEAVSGWSMRSEQESQRLTLLSKVLKELLASEDLAVRRTIGGIREVAGFGRGAYVSGMGWYGEDVVDEHDETAGEDRDLDVDGEEVEGPNEEEQEMLEMALRLSLEADE